MPKPKPSSTPLDALERILGETVVPAASSREEYVPVALDGLLPGSVLGFRVFVKVGEGFIAVHGREAPFVFADREQLLERKQATVYLHSSDAGRYQRYLELNLKSIVEAPQIPEPVKAGLVYHSAQGLMREILERPDEPRAMERVAQASSTLVDFLLRGREAFLHLLASCSVDYRTHTHSVHVAIFVLALARRLGVPAESLAEIGTGVLLHDIGKMRIDPAILDKPGPLTAVEWAILQKHPQWGLELVRARSEPTPLMADIILHHHEKLDGSGYPDGLKGDAISPVLRMVTICDVFDAITTNRPYKGALPTYDTLVLMKDEMKDKIDFFVLRELVLLLKR